VLLDDMPAPELRAYPNGSGREAMPIALADVMLRLRNAFRSAGVL